MMKFDKGFALDVDMAFQDETTAYYVGYIEDTPIQFNLRRRFFTDNNAPRMIAVTFEPYPEDANDT